jgi:formate/nitrite transporter FocA (FNT family)
VNPLILFLKSRESNSQSIKHATNKKNKTLNFSALMSAAKANIVISIALFLPMPSESGLL